MQQNNWPTQHISLDKILLDADNIRLNVTEKVTQDSVTQDSLLADLFNYENAMELVTSIAENGIFQDELPIVIEQDGKYIVIEGNRRIAALKALQTPNIAPAPFVTKIRDFGPLPPDLQRVHVVIAPSREATNKLIASKHTKNIRRPWKPLRQAYFYRILQDKEGKTIEQLKREFDPNVPRFIRMLEMHKIAKSFDYPPEIASVVHNERNFPISTLERVYDNQQVQKLLGFTFNDDGTVKIKSERAAFSKGYRRIVNDIANRNEDSRSLNTDTKIRTYIQSFIEKPLEQVSEPIKSESFYENKPPKEESKPSKIKVLKGVIPEHISFGLNSSALEEMYKELRNISVRTFPNAAHVLLRSFLECSLAEYLKQTDEYDNITKNNSRAASLKEMLNHLINHRIIDDNNVIQIAKHIREHYSKPYSLQMMNMATHNENYVSTEKDVRAAWAQMEKLMEFILNPGKFKI